MRGGNAPVADAATRASVLTSLPIRTVSGLAGLAVLVLVMWVGLPLLVPVVAAVAVLGLHEFRLMCQKKGIAVDGWPMYAFAILIIVASLRIPGVFPRAPEAISWREVALSAYAGYLLVREVVQPGEQPLQRVVYSLFAVFYVPFLLSYGLLLRDTPDLARGFWALLAPIVAAFASDTGGLFFGTLFGRHQLAPQVSPKKTLEGALGGVLLAFVFVFVLAEALPLRVWAPNVNVWDITLFSVVVSCAAQLGDLAESLIKRSLGVKDSGNFLPGHGGLLDRVDSVLFALPVAFYFIAMVLPG